MPHSTKDFAKALADLPPIDEAGARRLVALLGLNRPHGVAREDMNSEPLQVRLND